MKLEVRYDNTVQTIDLDAEATEQLWVSLSLEGYFNNCGLLRLDLRSDYEKQDTIEDILGIIIPETRDMFACEMIATKVVSIAQERIQALEHMGFSLSEESLIGHNGTKYDSYYVREV